MSCFKMACFRRLIPVMSFLFILTLKPLYGDILRGDPSLYQRGVILLSKGMYRESATVLQRFIETSPLNPFLEDAQYYLGLSFLKGGRYREALEEFDLYLKNFPGGKYRKEALEGRKKASLMIEGRQKGFMALQIHNFSSRTYEELEKEIREIKERGYDTIILRVFHNRGDSYYPFVRSRLKEGVYFRTTHAPVLGDVLTPVIRIARKEGLRVFAWMTTRYADYGLKGSRCRAYDFRKGLVYCRGLDLFDEKAMEYLEALYEDLARYPIDGILFQDDLILRYNEGFGEKASYLFKKETGYPLDPGLLYRDVRPLPNGRYRVRYTDLFWKWAEWKSRHLMEVAKRIMTRAKKRNRNIRFAVNLMYETAYKPKEALAWLSQSLEGARKAGFDYYAIMAYHRQIQEELGLNREETLEVLSKIADYARKGIDSPEKVLIKIQILDWKTREWISAGEVEEILKGMKEKGVSIALSPYKGYPSFRKTGIGPR